MIWGGWWEGGSGLGAHVHLWWIHVNVWQNQYSIVKQKNKIKKSKKQKHKNGKNNPHTHQNSVMSLLERFQQKILYKGQVMSLFT